MQQSSISMAKSHAVPAAQVIRLPAAAALSRRGTQVAMAIRRARRLSQTDSAAFADSLKPLLEGEDTVTATAVMAWESGIAVPSATVLLAAASVAGVELELLFCRRPLLARLLHLEGRVARLERELEGMQ